MSEVRKDPLPQTAMHPGPVWNWKDVFLISLGSMLILLAGVLVLNRLGNFSFVGATPDEGPSLLDNVVLAGLETIALVGSVYLLGMRRRGWDWSRLGLRLPSSGWMWSAVLIAFVFIPLMGLVALFIQTILGLPAENPQLPFLAPKNFSWLGAVGMILLGGLAVPFAEELFFRGVLYVWLRDRLGFWAAVLISSMIFGALHGEVSVAGATFVMGLALAWFYERSKSLWPSIFIHALNNSLKLILLYTLIASGVTIPGIQ